MRRAISSTVREIRQPTPLISSIRVNHRTVERVETVILHHDELEPDFADFSVSRHANHFVIRYELNKTSSEFSNTIND